VTRYAPVDPVWFPEITLVEIPDEDTILSERLAKFKERWIAHDPPLGAEYDVETLEFDPVVINQEVNTAFEIVALSRMNAFARATTLAFAWGNNLDAIASRYPGGVPRLPSETYDPATASVLEITRKDNAYRRRIWLAPNTLAAAGTPESYEYWARTVDGDLADCTVINPRESLPSYAGYEPGTVLITMMANGDDPIPSASRIIAVRNFLLREEIKPRTDIPQLVPPSIIEAPYKVRVWSYNNVPRPLVMELTQARLATLIENQRALGHDHMRAAISAAVLTGGVSDIEIIQPAQNVSARPNELVRVPSVSVEFAGVKE
jgi:phage-related baseplate assembly protein